MSNEKVEKAETDQVNGKTSTTSQKLYGDFLSISKDFSATTTNVAQKAASVMESEISAVIQVAKQMQSKSPIGEKVSAEKPDALVQRFRRDAHEVVDIFVDVFSFALQSADKTASAITAPLEEPKVTKIAQAQVSAERSVITAPSVKAGALAEIPISFENNGNVQTEEFKLYSTDLLSDMGERLSSSLIKFMPPALKIGPHQSEKVTVVVAVPKETKPGTYTGLVLAGNMNQLRSEIVLKVE
ncbi:MAG: hypothetical protein NWF05_00185 [Candidatus Bathyarchaeota archaeon]|nr:hypothetical protein [Candidatus Bathyarchaeota archaeon]